MDLNCNDYFQILLDSSNCAMILVNSEGSIIISNKEANELLKSKHEIPEQDLYELLPLEVSANFKIYINYSIASNKPQKFLFIIKDDVYSASIIPIKTSDNFQYITINIINVTYLQSSNKTSSINEKYMSVLNKASELLLKSYKNIPYQEFLITLSSALDVSRVYIFLNHWDSAGNAYMSQIAEWCSEGIEPQIDNPMLQNLPYGFSPRRWFETMTNGGIIIGNVSDSPEGEIGRASCRERV